MKDWTHWREFSEVGSWRWLHQRRLEQPWESREWPTSKESSSKRMMSKWKPTLISWHLISPIFPKKSRLVIASRGLNNKSQHSGEASNVKNMDITGRLAKDGGHVQSTVKKTLTIQRKSAQTKRNVQTANKTIWLIQDHVKSIKKKRKYYK